MIRFIIVVLFILIFGLFSIPLYFYVDHVGKTDINKKTRISQRVVVWAFKVILKFCRIKVEVSGIENIPNDQPVLYAANHRSYFDILVGYTTVPTLTGFVAKKEIMKLPVISTWMKRLNCVFLDRENPREGLKAILQGIENIKNGFCMFIMPEGTRNHGKELLPFKEGSFKMAEKTKCPIVPVAIIGTDDRFEAQLPRIKPGKVTITYGKPIITKDLSKEEKKDIENIVKAAVEEMLDKKEINV